MVTSMSYDSQCCADESEEVAGVVLLSRSLCFFLPILWVACPAQNAKGDPVRGEAAASRTRRRCLRALRRFCVRFTAPAQLLYKLHVLQVKSAKGKKGAKVDVTAQAGKSTVKTSYDLSEIRKLQSNPTTLYEAARISVLHSSFMEYLLRLSNERYSILAQWPDFTTMYGKDYYYRAHPEDLNKFYGLVDEFHRMYDVVTEFDSLSTLATDMVPAYRKKRMNILHPAITATPANGVVTQFLLSMK